jgi:hypothetical protein
MLQSYLTADIQTAKQLKVSSISNTPNAFHSMPYKKMGGWNDSQVKNSMVGLKYSKAFLVFPPFFV